MKEIGVSEEETGKQADDSTSEQRNVLPNVTTVVTTPEKKNETKKRIGGEWKPLAERMRPTSFEQMAVGELIGSKYRVIMNSLVKIRLFELSLNEILLLQSYYVGPQDVERQRLLL